MALSLALLTADASTNNNNSLQTFDLKDVGTMVVAPSPNTTRNKLTNDTIECYTYKKLTPLDIIEMQTKSSVVMEELMKDYEEELKNPIKGMISGNLMRSMLIQVQKLKVHTEAAMLTMDQILASNELTIAATAALPAIAILGITYCLFTIVRFMFIYV